MRALRTFVRGLKRAPPAVALPSLGDPIAIRRPEPNVQLDHLLDLALVMRELWLQDAGFAGDGHRARSIVLAALLRLFPDRAEPSVAACLARTCPAGECEDCPADAKTPAAWLDQFLDGTPRPLVAVGITSAEIDRVETELRTVKALHKLAQFSPEAGE